MAEGRRDWGAELMFGARGIGGDGARVIDSAGC